MNTMTVVSAAALCFDNSLRAGLIRMSNVNAMTLRRLAADEPGHHDAGLQDAQLADGAALRQLLGSQEQGLAERFLQMGQGR